jgi:hypothetical protein
MTLIKSGLACPFCESSDAYSEYQNGWYCFSCHKTKFKETPDTAVPEVKSYKQVELPGDFILTVPEIHAKWWRQYQIEDMVIKCHQLGWSETYKRIVIPVYNKWNDQLINWQGRAVFPNQSPKYTNVRGAEPYFFIANTCWADQDADTWDGWNNIVLVEDVLSAIKVNRAAPVVAIAMLGTGSKRIVKFLKELKPRKVILWLDGDQAGQSGSIKLFRQLNKFFTVEQILTNEDPKEYSNSQIEELIHGD